MSTWPATFTVRLPLVAGDTARRAPLALTRPTSYFLYHAPNPQGEPHVPSSHLQAMRQDHLGPLRPARRAGDGRCPGLSALRGDASDPAASGGGWLRKLFGRG